MSDEAGSASYQARLVEIFQSCDSANKGYLSLLEFERLCRQLQLQHQKKRLYQDLGLSRSSVSTKVYFEDFKNALLSLLQEVGPDSVTSGEHQSYLMSSDTDPDSSMSLSSGSHKRPLYNDPELHLDLPADMIADDIPSSDRSRHHKARSSPPGPLKRAFLEANCEHQDKERHQAKFEQKLNRQDQSDHSPVGKQRRSDSKDVETFEAEGQLASSPVPADHQPEVTSDSGLEQLRDVCRNLGVGYHGYLTQMELGLVCQYIGMDQMDDEELAALFNKLDADHDGYISFDEFVDGLSRHAVTTPKGFDTPTTTPTLRPLSGRKVRTPLPPAHQDRRSPAFYSSGDSVYLFSSLHTDTAGYAKGEELLDFWEKLNVGNGAEILMNLGFDPQTKLSLKELSQALSSECMGHVSEVSGLGQLVSATYQQEMMWLRCGLDQSCEERDKLRSDLADALSRNTIMATEVDERHAQLDRSHEAHLNALEQEYQEQLRHSQAELEREQEAHSSQAAALRQQTEQVQSLQQHMASLKERLQQAESEGANSQRELSQARDRLSEWESKYSKLKKDMQQEQEKQVQPDSPSRLSWEQEKQAALETTERLVAENKVLKDHNDELVAQLEELHQRPTSDQRRGSQGRSSSASRIPVRSRAASISSDTSEWDDEDALSSLEYGGKAVPETEQENEKVPLSIELKQQQRRQKRGERREREVKEIEHGFRVEIAELEDRQEMEKQQFLQNLHKEQIRMSEEFQKQLTEELAEQGRSLQNAFALEKQDLLQQYESRLNLTQLQHQEKITELEDRLKKAEKAQQQTEESKDSAANLYARNRVQELEKVKASLEKQLSETQTHYEAELEGLRKKYDEDLNQLKAELDDRLQAALKKVLDEGASALEGKLKEDFDHLVHQHRLEEGSSADSLAEKEEMFAAFERDKLGLVQHYESQIVALQEELGSLRHDFETERAAFQQLQSGDLAQSIRQELQAARRLRASRIRAKMFPMESISEQEEVSGQVDKLRQSWEEEKQELAVQNQLLEEELADMKGLLMQEKQRSAEAHTLKEHVRRLRFENKEVQCLAESLKEKVARQHQQQDLERANYERRIDQLEKEKERELRVQALQHAGSARNLSASDDSVHVQKDVLEQVIQEVEAMRSDSPQDNLMESGALDQLQSQITQLHHQLQEARTAQFEFQQLKDECELLRQTNTNLEDMVRVLRQRSDKEQAEREREEQDQLHERWEEKKKLQNHLQRTTDKLLKTSAQMAAGQTSLVREVEQLKQKAGNMVELETFTGLQVSLLETQRHAISLQDALMQRTQLADKIMAETEKERRQERDAWEEQKKEMQSRLDATTEMYRSLALQHKALRQSTTKLSNQMKELYVENANLMSVVQQTEARQIAAQRKNRKLQRQCQAWNNAVHRMLQQHQPDNSHPTSHRHHAHQHQGTV